MPCNRDWDMLPVPPKPLSEQVHDLEVERNYLTNLREKLERKNRVLQTKITALRKTIKTMMKVKAE